MPKRQEPPCIVRRVTRKHGAVFAEALERYAYSHGTVFEAFAETGLMEWPPDATQDVYIAIENEILEKMFGRVRNVIAAEFRAAAREVLDQERERRRAGRGSS